MGLAYYNSKDRFLGYKEFSICGERVDLQIGKVFRVGVLGCPICQRINTILVL